MTSNTPLICLMGPTASGKTQLAIELTQQFPFEIISVDSAMVYRSMDIGTSKPHAFILKNAPHRLIDIKDPAESYSAAQFCQDAEREIEAILQKGKIPLLVGGTMLYFHALQNGLSALPSADPMLRDQLNKEALEKGWPALHEQLQEKDPEAASRIHPHDAQRIQRALEIMYVTGKTVTNWYKLPTRVPSRWNIHSLGLVPTDRHLLHQRIAERFHRMLSEGLIDEVKRLFVRGDLNLQLPSIRSVGYRQIWDYLDNQYDHQTMIEKSIAATRQLAKRQLTWLRSWGNLIKLESEATNIKQQVITIISNLFEK